MTNPELESRTLELSRKAVESVTFFLLIERTRVSLASIFPTLLI